MVRGAACASTAPAKPAKRRDRIFFMGLMVGMELNNARASKGAETLAYPALAVSRRLESQVLKLSSTTAAITTEPMMIWL